MRAFSCPVIRESEKFSQVSIFRNQRPDCRSVYINRGITSLWRNVFGQSKEIHNKTVNVRLT